MWPEPLIQFNPVYQAGASIDALVAENVLSPDMAKVFAAFTLHKHQEEALRLGSARLGRQGLSSSPPAQALASC